MGGRYPVSMVVSLDIAWQNENATPLTHNSTTAFCPCPPVIHTQRRLDKPGKMIPEKHGFPSKIQEFGRKKKKQANKMARI